MSNRITAERARELLEYSAETGVFRWRVNRQGGICSGSVAGGKKPDGYIYIGVDGVKFLAHRLAWLYVHGKWPREHIDHINGVRDDNRLSNLREASNSENMQNQRRAQANNANGLLGVSWDEKRKRWQAQIKANGRKRHLGRFETSEEARAAYIAAKAELHPFQTITGGEQ